MWLPLTMRMRVGAFARTTPASTSETQGPAALTRARAATVSPDCRVSAHACPDRWAAMQRVRVRMSAPRSAASRAFSTTRRASSTQQSEYSKPRVNAARSGRAGRVGAQVEAAGRRQDAAAAQMVVEEETEADQRPGAEAGMVRQHEAQRPGDVRRHPQQHLALGQRRAHQPELAVLEVAQAAMDQLGRGRGGGAGEVALFDEQHGEAAPGGVAGNAAPVDAAADDGKVERLSHCGGAGSTARPPLDHIRDTVPRSSAAGMWERGARRGRRNRCRRRHRRRPGRNGPADRQLHQRA